MAIRRAEGAELLWFQQPRRRSLCEFLSIGYPTLPGVRPYRWPFCRSDDLEGLDQMASIQQIRADDRMKKIMLIMGITLAIFAITYTLINLKIHGRI